MYFTWSHKNKIKNLSESFSGNLKIFEDKTWSNIIVSQIFEDKFMEATPKIYGQMLV